MKRISRLFFLVLVPVIVSCSETKEQEQAETPDECAPEIQHPKYIGQYVLAQMDESSSELSIAVNCETKEPTQIELNPFGAYDSGYYLSMDKEGEVMYEFKEFAEDGSVLSFEAEGPDGVKIKIKMEEGDGNKSFKLSIGEKQWLLVPAEDKDIYPTNICKEGISEEDFTDEIIKVLHLMKNKSPELGRYIPSEGIIYATPGPGLHPYVDTILGELHEKGASRFSSKNFIKAMDLVQLHMDEEESYLNYVESMPDRCMPPSSSMFIIMEMSDDTEQASAKILLTVPVEDEEGVYQQVAVFDFYYDSQLWIRKIDFTECGA